MRTSKAGEIVNFERIYKRIYQSISDLKNSIDYLLIIRSNLNCKTDQCDATHVGDMA